MALYISTMLLAMSVTLFATYKCKAKKRTSLMKLPDYLGFSTESNFSLFSLNFYKQAALLLNIDNYSLTL